MGYLDYFVGYFLHTITVRLSINLHIPWNDSGYVHMICLMKWRKVTISFKFKQPEHFFFSRYFQWYLLLFIFDFDISAFNNNDYNTSSCFLSILLSLFSTDGWLNVSDFGQIQIAILLLENWSIGWSFKWRTPWNGIKLFEVLLIILKLTLVLIIWIQITHFYTFTMKHSLLIIIS